MVDDDAPDLLWSVFMKGGEQAGLEMISCIFPAFCVRPPQSQRLFPVCLPVNLFIYSKM